MAASPSSPHSPRDEIVALLIVKGESPTAPDLARLLDSAFSCSVVEAKGLPKMDLLGKCDPYTVARFGNHYKCVHAVSSVYPSVFIVSDGDRLFAVPHDRSACREKTKTIMKTLTPKWDETFKLCVYCISPFTV